jgi:hypothetical protein
MLTAPPAMMHGALPRAEVLLAAEGAGLQRPHAWYPERKAASAPVSGPVQTPPDEPDSAGGAHGNGASIAVHGDAARPRIGAARSREVMNDPRRSDN